MKGHAFQPPVFDLSTGLPWRSTVPSSAYPPASGSELQPVRALSPDPPPATFLLSSPVFAFSSWKYQPNQTQSCSSVERPKSHSAQLSSAQLSYTPKSMNMMMMTSDKNQLREIPFLHPTTTEASAHIFFSALDGAVD